MEKKDKHSNPEPADTTDPVAIALNSMGKKCLTEDEEQLLALWQLPAARKELIATYQLPDAQIEALDKLASTYSLEHAKIAQEAAHKFQPGVFEEDTETPPESAND